MKTETPAAGEAAGAAALAQLAQFWIERGSQFVAAGLTDQDVKWLRGADLGM
jgi:hypothetical protein